MKDRYIRLACLAFLLSLSGFVTTATARDGATYRPRVGEPFPDLVLPSLEDGSPLSISHFRGQKVILHVFASW